MLKLAGLTLALVSLLALCGSPAAAEDPPVAGGTIAWRADVAAAMAAAKESKHPTMVCINVAQVDGTARVEPAAKGLREIVYRDPRVVAASREFECVLLTKEQGSADYEPLRALKIEGEFVSPQHIFIHADGTRVLLRREYWSFGSGDRGVEAMLALMKEALSDPGKAGADAVAKGGPPADAEGRAKWIAERLAEIGGTPVERDRAIAQLILADKEFDCTAPLAALLPKYDTNPSTLRALARALGRDGLTVAALPLSELLKHEESTVRACAAVSLEYIGSRDKKVIAALLKLVGKEKDEAIANHGYRALGRCGVEDPKVRTLLLDTATAGKSEFATYGPCIGLAYFEGDDKAREGVEKLLKLIGVPGSRRGGGQNTVKRGLVSWTLASIGNAKSAKFVRDDLIAGLDNVKAFWVEGLRNFWTTVADVCGGEKTRLPEVEAGVRVFVSFAKNADLERYGAESRDMMDEARKYRENAGFKPKGDGLIGDGE